MNLKDRIAHYLARGLKASDVAEVVGCSPSYISQLLKDAQFKEAVEQQMQEAPPSEDDALATKYMGLEHKIVAEMSVAVSGAELPHLTRAMEAVARAQDLRERRKNPLLIHSGSQQTINVVSVMLPAHALQAPQRLTLNSQSEVVAIGEKALAPMSSSGVKDLFTRLSVPIEGVQDATSSQNSPQLATSTPADF